MRRVLKERDVLMTLKPMTPKTSSPKTSSPKSSPPEQRTGLSANKAPLAVLALGLLVAYGAATSSHQPPATGPTTSFGTAPRLTGNTPMTLPFLPGHRLTTRDLPSVSFDSSAVASVDAVDDMFRTVAFDLASVRTAQVAVPRIYLASLPADFSRTMPVAVRKNHFLRIVLPLVLSVNDEIRADRAKMFALQAFIDAGNALGDADRQWLTALAGRYRVDPQTLPLGGADAADAVDAADQDGFTTLAARVDTVSVALTLAQAIEESGWGRSRFARDGNALFGQRIWRRGGGIVPAGRGASQTFEVQAFADLRDSVRRYALNLNTNGAYARFRAMRRDLRRAGLNLDANALAGTLQHYSERGEAYIANLRGLIRNNQLRDLENATLEGAAEEA